MSEPLLRDISKVPRETYDFLWADYVELLCLCSRNGWVSGGNVQAQTQEAQDTEAADDEPVEPDETSAELDDRISKRWADIRRRLHARSMSWPGWPFRLEGSVVYSRFEPNNPEHRLYVALLIASSLRLCHNTRSGEVTRAFEEISYHWLRRSLNSVWQVRLFGAHQTLASAYPQTTLRAKFVALAADIKAVLQKPPEAYAASDTGDGGIDLVAWMTMGDQRGNWPVIFGQCACSPTDWESKQLSISPTSVEAHLTPQHPAAGYCFVPHDLHSSNTLWQRESHILRTVVIDRARILHLFRTTQGWSDLPHLPFVDEPAALQAEMAA